MLRVVFLADGLPLFLFKQTKEKLDFYSDLEEAAYELDQLLLLKNSEMAILVFSKKNLNLNLIVPMLHKWEF